MREKTRSEGRAKLFRRSLARPRSVGSPPGRVSAIRQGAADRRNRDRRSGAEMPVVWQNENIGLVLLRSGDGTPTCSLSRRWTTVSGITHVIPGGDASPMPRDRRRSIMAAGLFR